ncbi:DUF6931 family protein [Sphingomonas sp.]|uniref:DUF6931 family protein n=1 Tax=Sphingomonas sp. TaxID=28214 RepID=UPI003CC57278
MSTALHKVNDAMEWNQVRWTEAHQIASAMGADDDALPADGVTPEQHFRAMREQLDRGGAVRFLGHALPRLEALAWAARVLESEAHGRELKRADRQALDFSLRWLGDPSDQCRRAAKDAADAAGDKSPERLLAYGVFFSGGSIAPPDLAPIPPQPQLAGQFAASAIEVAAYRAADASAAFDRALDLGERVAADGLPALETA